MRLSSSTTHLLLAPVLAAAQIFPEATRSGDAAAASSVSADAASLYISLRNQPAFTSLADVMYTATGLPPDVYNAVSGDPVKLGNLYFEATATPTWLTAVPSDLSNYVQSVASAEASIIRKDSGAGSVRDKVMVWGICAAAGIVGVALL